MSKQLSGWFLLCLALPMIVAPAGSGNQRSDTHDAYATTLWKYIHTDSPYENWTTTSEQPASDVGPPCDEAVEVYMNKKAARRGDVKGAVVVTEHLDNDGELVALTIRVREVDGYHELSHDWYWAHYLADGTVVKTVADKSPYSKRGFVVFDDGGRLWVFRTGSRALANFVANGDLEERAIRPSAGPGGMTLMSEDNATIDQYICSKKGFVTSVVDGRLWVFREGAKEIDAFQGGGDLDKHVTRPAAGPAGMAVKGPDVETIEAYLTARPGFVTHVANGQLWVFRDNDDALADFEERGDIEKHSTRPTAGPGGMTVKAPEAETIIEYLAAVDGFFTAISEDQIWVFRLGTDAQGEFKENGEPTKQVARPGAGPLGMTVKGPDAKTVEAYLRMVDR